MFFWLHFIPDVPQLNPSLRIYLDVAFYNWKQSWFNWYRTEWRMNVDWIIVTVSSLQTSSPHCAVFAPSWLTAPASSTTTPTSAPWRPPARPRSSPSCPAPPGSRLSMTWPRVTMARPRWCPPSPRHPLSASVTRWRPLSPLCRRLRPLSDSGGGRGQWPRRCGGRGWRRSVTSRGCRAPSPRTPWWRPSRPGSTIKITRWVRSSHR